MSPHFFLALALAFTLTASAPAVEPWADPKLPVTDGLELWLDASRIDAAAKANKASLPPTASSRSGSMARARAGTSGNRSRPRGRALVKVGDAAIVPLRRRRRPPPPHRRQGRTEGRSRSSSWSRRGGTPAASAASSPSNAPNGRDYETGPQHRHGAERARRDSRN